MQLVRRVKRFLEQQDFHCRVALNFPIHLCLVFPGDQQRVEDPSTASLITLLSEVNLPRRDEGLSGSLIMNVLSLIWIRRRP